MKKKHIIMLLILILIIITIIFIHLIPNNKTTKKTYTKKEIVEKISEGFGNGINKKELEKLLNQKITDKTIMLGKDSYLLKMPSDKLIKKYNLTEYVKENKKYYKNIEKRIKDNYSWKFDDITEENQNTYFVAIKTYQYGVYLSDLEEMIGLLTANYSFSNAEQQEINNYKAKVIAMKLLNNHLNDYINENAGKTVAIFFTDINNDETKTSLLQYIIDLLGYTDGTNERINNMEINRTTRMQEYINDAINNNELNKNDILKI